MASNAAGDTVIAWLVATPFPGYFMRWPNVAAGGRATIWASEPAGAVAAAGRLTTAWDSHDGSRPSRVSVRVLAP